MYMYARERWAMGELGSHFNLRALQETHRVQVLPCSNKSDGGPAWEQSRIDQPTGVLLFHKWALFLDVCRHSYFQLVKSSADGGNE
jgi:hypothetical protein